MQQLTRGIPYSIQEDASGRTSRSLSPSSRLRLSLTLGMLSILEERRRFERLSVMVDDFGSVLNCHGGRVSLPSDRIENYDCRNAKTENISGKDTTVFVTDQSKRRYSHNLMYDEILC